MASQQIVDSERVFTQPDIPHAEPKLGKVAVLYTTPETVIDDYARLLDLAEIDSALLPDRPNMLKVNISWQHYYPACSSAPWQIEGVARKMQANGFSDITAAHNGTVVVDPIEGRAKNKQGVVEDKLGLKHTVLDMPPVKWVRYQPTAKMIALDEIYKDGLYVPEPLIGTNIVHLPTVKTHVFTTMTGAMKNAFGGLLHRYRHWTHAKIHETLVDLLQIQKEIHTGLFAVMDGTFAGDGPGPRAMRIHQKNIILASADQVAIDAVAAKLMGFDPMKLTKIRLAHEMGLGIGDPRQIEFVGDDVADVNWNFAASENTLASRGQKMIYWGPLKPLEGMLLRSPLVPWAIWASNAYHNDFWLRFVGRKRVREAMKTPWGELFQRY
jgi:uncharacterized protein (DUF362 family)